MNRIRTTGIDPITQTEITEEQLIANDGMKSEIEMFLKFNPQYK